MVVMTRRIGERIVIGGDIYVGPVEVHCRNVRIGIEAPREVEIHREEIHRKITRDAAALPASPAVLASRLRRILKDTGLTLSDQQKAAIIESSRALDHFDQTTRHSA